MKQKIAVLLLALVLLALASCAPGAVEKEDATKQPDLPNALETDPSNSPELQTNTVDLEYFVRFGSRLGCSAAYDPAFFTAEDFEDEYNKRVTGFSVTSIWRSESGGFPICVRIIPLDFSSVEEAINGRCGGMNLDGPGEETTFGAGSYAAAHTTYYAHTDYAVGEVYVTEQNGTVFMVEVSSFYRPPEKELALAYAILDSITF